MEEDRAAPAPNGWSGLKAITKLHELNERCFAALAEIARTCDTPTARSAIYRESELWKRVDQRARERAGSCPVFLLNLNFESLDWWTRVGGDKRDAPPTPANPAVYDERQAKLLAQEVLMEAWQLGRTNPNAANLFFGMAHGVSAEIAELSSRLIDRVASDYAKCLRPRWEENAIFWKRLLEAVIGTDDEALFAVHLHCFQLLGSALEFH